MATFTTVEEHIQHNSSEAHRGLAEVMGGITLATKMIEAKIRAAGLSDVYGAIGQENVQGEQQQKLDVFANEAMIDCLRARDVVAALVSEEDEHPVAFERSSDIAKYIVIFDPLDGSSNIDVNVNVGTIFSVHLMLPSGSLDASVLQPGTSQVAAGYVVYGPSTVLVYTTGSGVHSFTLDPAAGAFVLTQENMKMPEKGPYYSVNDGNSATWPDGYANYVQSMRDSGYSARYIGSLVADFHRTLLKGGVFLYPPNKQKAGGKLRLLYEANPLAFLAEQASGMASSGTGRILELQPREIHQRTPFMVGSRHEMQLFDQAMKG